MKTPHIGVDADDLVRFVRFTQGLNPSIATDEVLRGEAEAFLELIAPEPKKFPNLSDRETAILHLIAGGLTNEEIAAKLALSLNTVKFHIRMAYQRIGVERRSQAVRWVLENF